MQPNYELFINKAKTICTGRVWDSYLMRYALGVDASCYNYVPKVVIRANNESEVIALLALVRECHTPITFRAAGTSLSGQCSSDSVLIIANEGFKSIEIKGNVIECGCGVIGCEANAALAEFGKKIGPDPATIATALIGGIFNNNSSGMCCGVEQNSYNTIHSIRAVLLDGTIIDTSDKNSVKSFCKSHKQIVESLQNLRAEILADTELTNLIARKYKIKNTKRYTRLLPTSRALWLCKNAPTMVSRTIEITSAKIATSIAVLSHSQFLPNSLNKIDKSPTLITGKMMINTGETPKI